MSEPTPDYVFEIVEFFPQPNSLKDIKPTIRFFSSEGQVRTFTYLQSTNIEQLNWIKRKRRIILIVHGYMNNIDTPWMQDMKEAILEMHGEDEAVAIIGWGGGAHSRYATAAANISVVADWLCEEILYPLHKWFPDTSMWGIGHSLGAHLMGQAGRKRQLLDRITGLDPAGPSFERHNTDKRLTKGDARLVDVIHTDGFWPGWPHWPLPNHYGTLIPLGDIDFYPNGGYEQPGTLYKLAGSHSRAYDLFTWSVKNQGKFYTNLIMTKLPAYEKPVPEEDWRPSRSKNAEMGYYADKYSSNGCFPLKTAKGPPFAK